MDKFANSEKEKLKTHLVEQDIPESVEINLVTEQVSATNQDDAAETHMPSAMLDALSTDQGTPENTQSSPNHVATKDSIKASIILQCLIVTSLCLLCALIAPNTVSIASTIFLVSTAVFASWSIRIKNRLSLLLGKRPTNSLISSLAAIHPVFTLLIIGAMSSSIDLNSLPSNVHFGYGLVTLVFWIVHLVLRVGWLFSYPAKIVGEMKKLRANQMKVLNELAYKFGMISSFVFLDLAIFGCLWSSGNQSPQTGLILLFQVAILQGGLSYFIDHKINNLVKLRTRGQINAALVRAQDGYNLDEEMIGYKPMASTERWMKQRFSHGSAWKPLLLALMVGGILLLNPGQRLDELLTLIFKNTGGGGGGGAVGGIQALFSFNQIFVTCFGGFFISLVAGLGVYLLRLPTAIITGPRGLRFLYHSSIGREDRGINWSDLTEIRLERKLNSASTLSDCLLFKTPKKTVKLKLDNFKTGQDKEKLLHAIESFAPTVPRDAAIMEVLALPADHSYTEVWMTALSAPPKRERLKPLTADAVMNEGNYTVVKELGSGGQGFAYLAKDKEDKEVVLKEFVLPIYVDIQARRKALERFENEARLLSRLDDPQVVKLLGFFIEDHRAYLVLEHIDGKNLRQIVAEKGHFSEEETKVLLAKMCKILSYLHSLEPPLVHRDFTPDNLILDKDGNLKLIDFNVAQEMQDGTTGTVVGKQAYLPPEQFRGQAEPASDVYAMGATLYYLLTGKDPTPISTLRVSKELPDLDPQLDQLMTQLTSMDPALRPTADEVLKGQEQAKADD